MNKSLFILLFSMCSISVTAQLPNGIELGKTNFSDIEKIRDSGDYEDVYCTTWSDYGECYKGEFTECDGYSFSSWDEFGSFRVWLKDGVVAKVFYESMCWHSTPEKWQELGISLAKMTSGFDSGPQLLLHGSSVESIKDALYELDIPFEIETTDFRSKVTFTEGNLKYTFDVQKREGLVSIKLELP